jgi:hypothetical protein
MWPATAVCRAPQAENERVLGLMPSLMSLRPWTRPAGGGRMNQLPVLAPPQADLPGHPLQQGKRSNPIEIHDSLKVVWQRYLQGKVSFGS